MLQDVVLHNLVVAVSVYADVRIMGEAESHNASEDAVSIWITGYSMDYMIRLNIINPLTFIDLGISRFWGWQKSKIANDLIIILNDKGALRSISAVMTASEG